LLGVAILLRADGRISVSALDGPERVSVKAVVEGSLLFWHGGGRATLGSVSSVVEVGLAKAEL